MQKIIILSFSTGFLNFILYKTLIFFFSIYVMGRVFEWIKRHGGVEGMQKNAATKSRMLYDLIDSSDGFYSCPVKPHVRSRMNVPFRVGGAGGDEALEEIFLKGAQQKGMLQLKGHRLVKRLLNVPNYSNLKSTKIIYTKIIFDLRS